MIARPGRPPVGVAVTGGGGFLGRFLLPRLRLALDEAWAVARGPVGSAGGPAEEASARPTLLALDVRLPAEADRLPGVVYEQQDIRSPDLGAVLQRNGVEEVVHLAFVVDPKADPAFARDVDVNGSRNLLEACLAAGVRGITVISSGAVYGYDPAAAEWLDEDHPLLADETFPYALHKRLVEELLADYRADHPELRQLVLRPGAILGPGVATAATAPFDGRVVIGVRGAAAPFAFVWVEDVADVITQGVLERRAGIYNVVGDGVIALREVAAVLGKRYLALPLGALRFAIRALGRLGLTGYEPAHLDFLRFRPVPKNDRLKADFGPVLRHSAREALLRHASGDQAPTGN